MSITVKQVCQEFEFRGFIATDSGVKDVVFSKEVCGFRGDSAYAQESFKSVEWRLLTSGPTRNQVYGIGSPVTPSISYKHKDASAIGEPRMKIFKARTVNDYIDFYCGGLDGAKQIWCRFVTVPFSMPKTQDHDECGCE